MNLKVLLFIVCIATTAASSQETLHLKNSKPYRATKPWNFICANYALTGAATIQIAKTEKGGILKLAVATTNPAFTIAGTTYVYLTDNFIITCTDKGIRDNKENQIVSYYFLTPLEMTKIKTTDIQSIRFNIIGKSSTFNSQTGNFSAVNKKTYFSKDTDKTSPNYTTALEVKALYL